MAIARLERHTIQGVIRVRPFVDVEGPAGDSYSTKHMEENFPAIVNYPEWDKYLHPYNYAEHFTLDQAYFHSRFLLPDTWTEVRPQFTPGPGGKHYSLLQPQDFYPDGGSPWILYMAWVGFDNQFHRALYEIDQAYDNVAKKWWLHLVDGNFDEVFPISIAF